MKTITLTDEQYQALCNGESVTIEPPKPEKWKPKGGNYHVDLNGEVFSSNMQQSKIDFGVVYQTREAAEKARDAMRTHNRVLAWLAENDDGWVADWSDSNQDKWSVFYAHETKKWVLSGEYKFQNLGSPQMSEANAEKLCKLLNDGVVEL